MLVPALAVVALLLYWAAAGGGYPPTTWLPSGLAVLGLLVATLAGLGLGRVRLPRSLAIALALLGGYVAFSYLSILWAASPGDALEGSNRALLYLLLFALFAVLPWRVWSALTTLTAFALGIGAIALVTLVRLTDAEAVPGLFTDARLDAPLGYVNGSAALLLAATVLSVALAARRELPSPLRGVLLAGAAAALQLSVLCESRGWLFSLPVVLILMLALVPGRVRLVLWMLPPLAGTALALPALLDVFARADAAENPAAGRRALVEAAGQAADVALLVCAGVLLAGMALATLDRRVRISARVERAAGRGGAAIAIASALAAVVVGLAMTDGRPWQPVGEYWERSSGYQASDPGSSRFVAVGSNRPDFWRVSLEAFAERPIGGLGQDNWGAYYLRERESSEQPRWTHSLELRLLAHTGAIGTLLFAGFLLAAVTAAVRGPTGRRRAGRLRSAVGATALLPLVVWLVHGSVDWFWEIPALSGPALAFLALGGATMAGRGRGDLAAGEGASAPAARAAEASAPAAGRADASARRRTAQGAPAEAAAALQPGLRGPWRVVAAGGLGALALVAALALALPYLAAREVVTAGREWHTQPASAFARLERAERLNPLSARPALVAGVIALELGRARLAEARFGDALARDGGDWFAHFGRGIAASARADRAAARADFERARGLDPGEELVRDALERLDTVRPLTAREAFERLRRDVELLTGDQ